MVSLVACMPCRCVKSMCNQAVLHVDDAINVKEVKAGLVVLIW